MLKPDEITFLSSANNIRLIEAVYANQSLKNKTKSVVNSFNYFSPPDMLIYPGDYSDLVNFKEIVENILPIVKFAMHNNEYVLQILNSKSGVWVESKTILLNGVPFTDLSYVATLGTKDIRRIEIINSNFFIGELTRPVLLSIYTNDNKVPELYLKNFTIPYKNTVITNGMAGEIDTHDSARISKEHSPDFKNTLFWKPDARISNRRNLIIEFPASMLTGMFTVKVQGLTLEMEIRLALPLHLKLKNKRL